MSLRLYAVAALLLAAALGLEVHRRNVVSRERARLGLLRDDVELFTDALSTSLRHPEACAGTFGTAELELGATRAVELNYAAESSAPAKLRAGTEPWPGTQLNKLTLTLPEAPDMRTLVGARELRRFRARLDAEFIVGERFARGVSSALDLILWLDQRGRVDSCFGPLSVGSVCNMMGGYYDVGGEPRCRQIAQTLVGAPGREVVRGSCRVGGLAASPGDCRPRRGALTFQSKMGYGTAAQTLCRTCD